MGQIQGSNVTRSEETQTINSHGTVIGQGTAAAVYAAGAAGEEGTVQLQNAVGHDQKLTEVTDLHDFMAPLPQQTNGVGRKAAGSATGATSLSGVTAVW